MATRTFLPSTDAALLAWSNNFSTLITAHAVLYGLSVGQATAYAGLHATYAADLAACDPGVRNKMAVTAKNNSRSALKANASLLAGLIEHTSTVTDEQKVQLQLNVRARPTPIPPPATAPVIDIISSVGNAVKIRLHDAVSPRRGRPTGVAGAALFSFVGAAAPTDESAWTFQGLTTRTTATITFPNTVAAGSKVWITAYWRNPRDQSGPAATAVGTNIPGGAAMAA